MEVNITRQFRNSLETSDQKLEKVVVEVQEMKGHHIDYPKNTYCIYT